MLKLREEQMVALRAVKLLAFEGRLLDHAQRYFPGECAALGEAESRIHVHRAVERAQRYGINSERDLCKYLNLTFSFGRDFDTDPAHAWMGEILRETDSDPSHKLNRLYNAAVELQKRSAPGASKPKV